MAQTQAVIGYGSQFWLKPTAGTSTKIAEIIALALPNPQTDDVEATHFESPGRSREFIAGLIDQGELQISMNYIAGGATDGILTTAQASGDVMEARIVIPTPAGQPDQQFVFPCLIKGYEKNIPIDDRQTATATVRVAGAVVQSAVAEAP